MSRTRHRRPARAALLAIALAGPGGCRPPEKAPADTTNADTGPGDTESPDTDTGTAAGVDTDVIVIGSGPAGLAAGLAVHEQGREVQIYDRADLPAASLLYAGAFFAAGTPEQAAAGVEDSPDLAAADWESVTGVDGETPSVRAWLDATAETLAWLEGYGVTVDGLFDDPDVGSVLRVHGLNGVGAREALLAELEDDIHTGVEVDRLLADADGVYGVSWIDRASGETGQTTARAVIVATGGFLRDRSRVDALRPDLAGRRLLYETGIGADGGGLPLVEALGAGTITPENIGLYVNGIQDPTLAEGEALLLSGISAALFVDSAGARFIDEAQSRSLDVFAALPTGEVTAVLTDTLASQIQAVRPGYNGADPFVVEQLRLDELVGLSDDVFTGDSLDALAAAAGLDATGLRATIDEVNAQIALGGTDAFGRDFAGEEPFEDDLWWALRLTPGLAKAYGGLATDLDGAVLDGAGAPIPGLFAAGEVVGMIPGGGAGEGFAGSLSACFYGGRLAGTQAAAP